MSDTIKTVCGHCHKEYEMGEGHDCEPNCIHCGATFDDLEDPEYDHAKIAVSRHERECDDRPESWGAPIDDPEAQFREERRERKHIRQWEDKQCKRRHVW